jgi:hypothetical protein
LSGQESVKISIKQVGKDTKNLICLFQSYLMPDFKQKNEWLLKKNE